MKMTHRQIAAPVVALWAAIACILSLPAGARETEPAAKIAAPPATENRAQEDVPVHPALWKVADEDTTIYLFGTIHVLPKGIYWHHGKVAEAFAQSGSLVTEITEDDPARMQGLVVKLAMLPRSQTLRGQLGSDERAAYEAALALYKIPPALFDRFEPWYAAVALSTIPLMQDGFDAAHGVEELLNLRAKERKLPHQGLETAEYQLGLFDGLPKDVQKRYLSEVIEQLPTIKENITAMIEAWKQGNAAELAKLMNAGETDPVLLKTLLIDRNREWAKWLDERLDEPGTVFVAVGAGHLAGTGSVQDQLTALGIASTRLQ
ncbi:MAG: TraB/GumN family protein [Sphingomonadaceae bacterium]|nr:TraB/GumN family protein [Sphingomonadaceae bacterium]